MQVSIVLNTLLFRGRASPELYLPCVWRCTNRMVSKSIMQRLNMGAQDQTYDFLNMHRILGEADILVQVVDHLKLVVRKRERGPRRLVALLLLLLLLGYCASHQCPRG